MKANHAIVNTITRSVAILALLLCVAIATTSCGRQSEPHAPKGSETYRAIDEKTILVLRRSGEAELSEDGQNFVGTYTEEGPRVRVVVSIFGTTQAIYFGRTAEGLKHEDGGVLYDAKTYPKVMERVVAQRRQASLDEQLLATCETGNVEQVKHLLQAGANVNTEDGTKNTPLRAAVKSGNLDTVRTLLVAGADVNRNTGQGTALHLCLSIGGRRGWLEFVRDRTPADDAIFKTLMESGADINAVTDKGYSPLMVAVIRQHLAAIRHLVSLGANRTLKATDGKSVYSLAEGRDDVLAALRTKQEEVSFQQTMSAYRSLLAGHYWRWESSLSRYGPDGQYEEVLDDGTRVSGSWSVESGKLILKESKRGRYSSSRTHEFWIQKLTPNTCVLRNNRGDCEAKGLSIETVAQLDSDYRKLMARQWRWDGSTTDYKPDGTFVEQHDSGKISTGNWRIEAMRLYVETSSDSRNRKSDTREFFIESLSNDGCKLKSGDKRFLAKPFGPAEMTALMEKYQGQLPGKWQFGRYVQHFRRDGTYDEIYDRPAFVRSGTWTITRGPRLVLRERTAGGRPVRSFDRKTNQQVNYEEKSYHIRDISDTGIALTDEFNRSVDGTSLGK